MNTRLVEVFAKKNYVADATEIIDINLSDPISQLIVTIEPEATESPADAYGHPVRCLDKIELVDGSDVLFSLSGAEAQGVDFYHNWQEPYNKLMWLTGNYMVAQAKLNFGRFLYDPSFAMDPARFNNLQLKIKLDLDAGGIRTDDMYLTVMAHVFDEKKITPSGFIMAKELKQYSMVTSGHEYTDLPVDYPYKQLFFRSQAYNTEPQDQMDTFKLSEDHDKKIPLNNLTILQLMQNMIHEYGKYREWSLHSGYTEPYSYYCTPTFWVIHTATPWKTNDEGRTASCYGGHGGKFTIDMSIAGPNWQTLCEGYAPHAVYPLLPDYSNDPADWYDPRNLKSLRLDVKAGASILAGSTAEIIAQQLRLY